MLAGGISLLPWKEGLEPGILPPSGVSSQLPSCLWLGFPPAAALPCVNHWIFTEQGEKTPISCMFSLWDEMCELCALSRGYSGIPCAWSRSSS